MIRKKSSYQKLKDEIQELQNDIHILVMSDDFITVNRIKQKHQMRIELENAAMYGKIPHRLSDDRIFFVGPGLMDKIKKGEL